MNKNKRSFVMAISTIVVVINGVAAIAKATLTDSNIKNNNIAFAKKERLLYIYSLKT